MSLRIDRCLCFGQTFTALKDIAERTGATTLPDLQAHVAFGHRCQLCHPYVRRMLQTGETMFHHLLPAETVPENPLK
jgi:bacterioferritin-associated ferredoxin